MEQEIYRTTPERTARMMAIMLGICVAGGAIFFGLWDYWISEVPPVARAEPPAGGQGAQTGEDVHVSLTFVESEDFRTLAFDALPGEEGSNPEVSARVGDRVVFDVDNGGLSFHSFGVTRAEEGIEGVIPGTEVALPTNPLKPGESGTSEFVPAEEGVYYYICTVPGHREQGMVGVVRVGPAAEAREAAPPTGVSHSFELDFVESEDFRTLAFDALPGEEGSNPEFRVASGDEVTFTATNEGRSFHSFGVVASPEDFGGSLWGSEIASQLDPLKPGESGSATFTAGAPGEYYYICTVAGHALQGMQGRFVVE